MAWAPDYATTGELAAHVRIGDTADDAQLALAVAAASRTIDRACSRQFGKLATATARYYTARWDPRRCLWFVVIDDLMSSTGLTVKYDEDEDQTYGTTLTDYVLRPINAASEGRPWTELWVRSTSDDQPTALEDGMKVTAAWGWSGVPDAIRQACLLQASRLLARRDAPFGIAGSPDAGSEMRLLARLDPDVSVAVRPYRRAWGAV